MQISRRRLVAKVSVRDVGEIRVYVAEEDDDEAIRRAIGRSKVSDPLLADALSDPKKLDLVTVEYHLHYPKRPKGRKKRPKASQAIAIPPRKKKKGEDQLGLSL
jgi:hypothetical protein